MHVYEFTKDYFTLTKDEFYDIQIIPHKAVRKRIRDYHEQLYAHESDNLR